MTGPHCLINMFREIRQLHLQRWPCLLGSNCPLSRIGGVCPLPNPAPSRSLCVDFHSRQELLTLLPSLCANLFAFVLHVVCMWKCTCVGCTHVHTHAEVSCWRRMSSSAAVCPIHWPLSLDSLFAQQDLYPPEPSPSPSPSPTTRVAFLFFWLLLSISETLPEASSCLLHARSGNHTDYRPLFFFVFKSVMIFFPEKCLYKHFYKLLPKNKWPSGIRMLSSSLLRVHDSWKGR